MIRLTLPYPPTSNHNTMVAKGRRISSPKYRAWRTLAEISIRAQSQGQTVPGLYSISYFAERPDKRRRDLENLPKSLSDALQSAGLLADDANCERSTISWLEGVSTKGCAVVHVNIEPL